MRLRRYFRLMDEADELTLRRQGRWPQETRGGRWVPFLWLALVLLSSAIVVGIPLRLLGVI